MQLHEEEKIIMKILKTKVESAELKNIVQRINSIKNLMVSLQKNIESLQVQTTFY